MSSHFRPEIQRYILRGHGGRFALAARIDDLLKLGMIASLLLASSGIGYYYAVYLPRRDAQLDNDRMVEKTRAYAQKRAEQARLASEQMELAQRQAADKAAAEIRYQTCLNRASATHDASWAAECKRIADKAREDHTNCLAKPKLSQGYCDLAYRARDASPNCTLPLAVATDLDGDLTKARNRCQQERAAALQ